LLQELRGGGRSTHVGHHYVQYRHVRPLQFRQAERLPPVSRRKHLVPEPGLRLPGQLADRVVILGREDCFRAVQVPRLIFQCCSLRRLRPRIDPPQKWKISNEPV